MNPAFLITFLAMLLRHGLVVFGAWFVNHHWADQASADGLLNYAPVLAVKIVGWVSILAGLAWSYFRTHDFKKQIGNLLGELGRPAAKPAAIPPAALLFFGPLLIGYAACFALVGCTPGQQTALKATAVNVGAQLLTYASDPTVQADTEKGLAAAGKLVISKADAPQSAINDLWTYGNFFDALATGQNLTSDQINDQLAAWGLKTNTDFSNEVNVTWTLIYPLVKGDPKLIVTWLGILAQAARDAAAATQTVTTAAAAAPHLAGLPGLFLAYRVPEGSARALAAGPFLLHV